MQLPAAGRRTSNQSPCKPAHLASAHHLWPISLPPCLLQGNRATPPHQEAAISTVASPTPAGLNWSGACFHHYCLKLFDPITVSMGTLNSGRNQFPNLSSPEKWGRGVWTLIRPWHPSPGARKDYPTYFTGYPASFQARKPPLIFLTLK